MLDALTLDQLRIFVAISETGSFSAASRRLGRAQSAISHSVRSLETTLGIELFDRSGWSPVPTDAGRSLLADARALVASATALRSRARNFAEGTETELAVAADPLFPAKILMDCLHRIEIDHPSITIRLITDCIGGPQRRLRSGEVSLAICCPEMEDVSGLSAVHLGDVRMIPVVAVGHPLAGWTVSIPHTELARHTQLVLSDTEPSVWSRGVAGDRIWRFVDPHTRLRFLLDGFGWCHVAEHEAAPHVADGTLVRLRPQEATGYTLRLHAVHRPDIPLGRVGQDLLRTLIERAPTLDVRSDVEPPP